VIGAAVATLALLIWLGLLFAHGGFWRAREREDTPFPAPPVWPEVVAIVPARDEADVIGRVIGSLVVQDYPGPFRILLIDDGSRDGTAERAREAARGSDRLEIVTGAALPPGWTGKLWAMAQGVERSGGPRYLWFTDADIAHAPDTLAMLVARAEAEKLVLHSLMAELRCDSLAEKALIPAFVFFFAMLYPFRRVNDPASRTAGAAGGCMLVRREALAAAGGIAAFRGALIDDCAMGAALKKQGPIRLSLTRRSVSIRPYGDWQAVGAMIARSAYAQLRYSPWLLFGTLAGLALVYLAPPLAAIFGAGWTRLAGAAAWLLMAAAFQPMLAFYRRSPLWGAALPAIALFYAGATLLSAVRHWQGRGGMWKGRAQAGMKG